MAKQFKLAKLVPFVRPVPQMPDPVELALQWLNAQAAEGWIRPDVTIAVDGETATLGPVVAIRDEPHMLAHRYNLALAYAGADRPGDAQRTMRELVAIEPGYVKAYLWLGRHHADRGEYPVASWWLAEALDAWSPEEPRREQVVALLEQVEARMRESGQTRLAPPPL